MIVKSRNSTIFEWIKTYKTDIAAYGGLLFCIVIFSILTPIHGESIWSASRIETLITNVIVIALMSIGASFVYALGTMDISIGKQVGLYATLMVVIGNKTDSLVGGIVLSVIIAIVIGIINGSIGEIFNIHPIISSLVVMMVLSGISSITYSSLGSRNVALKTINYRVFKEPRLMILVLIIEILIVSYLFNYTKLGKYVKAIGANPVVAKQSGINIVKYKVIAYIIMGLCVVLASVFQMGYTGSASDSTGTGFEMNVMVALILGGMSLSGGMKSKVSCAVVGSFTYSLLDVGLPMIGVPVNQVYFIKAIIFIVVVLITSRKQKGILPR